MLLNVNNSFNISPESEIKDNDFDEINEEISKALINMTIGNINDKKENETSFPFSEFENKNNSYNLEQSNLSFTNKISSNLNTNAFSFSNSSFNMYNTNCLKHENNKMINSNNNNFISFKLNYVNNSISYSNFSPNFFINNNLNKYNINTSFNNNIYQRNFYISNYNRKEWLDSPKNIINLNNILTLKDKRTTVMIRNIPNKYNLNLLLNEINNKFSRKFDVLYLPLDVINNSNLGFGFINFTNPIHIFYFFSEFNNKKWNHFNSEKRCQLVYSKTQSKKGLIKYIKRKNSINNFSNKNPNCFYIKNNSYV